MLTVPADPTYRRLFSAQIASLTGTGLATVALALLAYDLSGGDAGAVLGTALALKMVAYVVISPLIGGLAHRLPRRSFLIGLDVARAGIVCLLPWASEVWHVYALIFLLNACSAGFTPLFQATIPDVLTEEREYTRALSLARLAYDLENLASPTLAAAALLIVSYDTLFVFNGVTFLVSAALIASVRLPLPRALERETDLGANILFGLRSYLCTPRLKGLLALCMTAALAGAMVIVNTVVYVRGALGGSEAATALVLAAYGFGSMVAALALPELLEKYPDRRFMLGGGALLVLGLLSGLLEPGYAGIILIWSGLGLGSSLILTPAGRLIVRSSRAADRPAFYAAQFALSHACWLIAYPLAGWTGAGMSLTAAFGLTAAGAAVSLLVAWRVWPPGSEAPLEHRHDRITHEHLHVHDEHHQHVHSGSESGEPHSHPHTHEPVVHRHDYVIDLHHPSWPTAAATHAGNR